MSKLKYTLSGTGDRKLVKGSQGIEIRSQDVYRVAPNSSVVIKTGVTLKNLKSSYFIVNSFILANNLSPKLVVMNPMGVTNFSGTEELEILAFNFSLKTVLVNYNDQVACLISIKKDELTLEGENESDSSESSEESELLNSEE